MNTWLRSSLCCMLLVLSAAVSRAQKDSSGLVMASKDLNRALIQKDEVVLNRILSKDLTYGHSNGWIEHKKELIDNLENGKLSYSNITLTDVRAAIEGKTGVIRCKGVFDIKMDGRDLQFKLSVLQVWVWKKGKWILMSRQSVKEEQIK